jgi:hypothetical protein
MADQRMLQKLTDSLIEDIAPLCALRGDPNIELLMAGRRIVSAPGAEDVPGDLIEIDEAGFAQALKAYPPDS